jgi:predicted  nucleic acid-binding Zn-ribbon protein
LKIELDATHQQLQNEITQNQERKKKVRAFVDSLTEEKNALEATVAQSNEQLQAMQARVAVLETQLQNSELKISTAKDHVCASAFQDFFYHISPRYVRCSPRLFSKLNFCDAVLTFDCTAGRTSG